MRPDAIIKTLEDAGFEARYVGGCVRDTLLGRPIHDWDVTTSALPEQILALFPSAIPTDGIHGIILNPWNRTLMLDKTLLQIILGSN